MKSFTRSLILFTACTILALVGLLGSKPGDAVAGTPVSIDNAPIDVVVTNSGPVDVHDNKVTPVPVVTPVGGGIEQVPVEVENLPLITPTAGGSPVVPVIIQNLPLVTPTAGGLPMVPITVTSPITVVTYLPTPVEASDEGPLKILMAAILSKLIVLALFTSLASTGQIEKIELALKTSLFCLVDAFIFFPRYEHYDATGLGLLYNFVINLQALWFVFWIVVVFIIPRIITFLAKDIAHV